MTVMQLCLHCQRRFTVVGTSKRQICSERCREKRRRAYQADYRKRHYKQLRVYKTEWQARARLDNDYRERENRQARERDRAGRAALRLKKLAQLEEPSTKRRTRHG